MKAGSYRASGVGSKSNAFFFSGCKAFFPCSPHLQSLYCYLIHIAKILLLEDQLFCWRTAVLLSNVDCLFLLFPFLDLQ